LTGSFFEDFEKEFYIKVITIPTDMKKYSESKPDFTLSSFEKSEEDRPISEK
jgi:hypothetical protein